MRILLAIIVSTVFAGTVFGACGVDTPQQCSEKTACDELNQSSKDGRKYDFKDNRPVKCMLVDTVALSKCGEIKDISKNQAVDKSDPSKSGGDPAKDVIKK